MNETFARETIQVLFGHDHDPLAHLDDDGLELAVETIGNLMTALPLRDESMFIFSMMTLTYLGCGFTGRKAMDKTFVLAKANYRAGRTAIKEVCATAVDELIASIQADQ